MRPYMPLFVREQSNFVVLMHGRLPACCGAAVLIENAASSLSSSSAGYKDTRHRINHHQFRQQAYLITLQPVAGHRQVGPVVTLASAVHGVFESGRVTASSIKFATKFPNENAEIQYRAGQNHTKFQQSPASHVMRSSMIRQNDFSCVLQHKWAQISTSSAWPCA